jgi:hypothetical protein
MNTQLPPSTQVDTFKTGATRSLGHHYAVQQKGAEDLSIANDSLATKGR